MSKLSLGVEKEAGRVTVLGPMGRYIELDQAVDRADGDGLVARWDFGQEVLSERVDKGKGRRPQLPRGRVDEIASAVGKSTREVTYRAAFAARYRTRDELRNAIAEFGSWFRIVNEALAAPARLAAGDRKARQITPGGDDAQGDGWAVFAGDFSTIPEAKVPDASVDLILTDPPYPEESAHLWDKLAAFAARVLVPGGILATLAGKIHVDDRMGRLKDGGLQYGWIYAQPLPGSNTRILARQTLQEWKPWLCYSNGPWPSGRLDWHGDLLVAGPRVKDAYEWQQQVEPAVQLIERLTHPDDVVLDPFLGSGTYGLAALQTGRQFYGIELDAGRVASATDRLRAAERAAA